MDYFIIFLLQKNFQKGKLSQHNFGKSCPFWKTLKDKKTYYIRHKDKRMFIRGSLRGTKPGRIADQTWQDW